MSNIFEKKPDEYQQYLREKRFNGLLFGLIASFWFSAGVWALDWALLTRASADLAWLKFMIGAPFVLIIGGAVGWLTARLDNAAIGAVLWMLAGIVFVWISSHTPFEGQSKIIGILDPNFSGMEIYPFVESARIRMILLYVLVGVLTAIGGSLELFFVESATRASGIGARLFSLATCLVIFLPIGLLVDNLINQALRTPIVGTDDLIRFGVEARQGRISKETQRDMGVRALTVFGDRITIPYRLILGSYDPETFEETIVHVDFSGDWGSCSVLLNRPMNCRLSSERYLKKLDCMIRHGTPEDCKLRLEPGNPGVSADVFGELDSPPLEYGILGQRGSAVLAVVEDQEQDQVKCILQDTGDVYLESCTAVSGEVFRPIPLPPTATPPAIESVPTQIQPTADIFSSEPTPAATWKAPAGYDLTTLETAPRYLLALEIADDLQSFEGTAVVTYKNAEAEALDELFFRLLPNGGGSYGNGSLIVKRTTVSGSEAAAELSVEDTALKVPLEPPLQPGDQIEIRFEFDGQVPLDFGGTKTPAGYGIYNLSDDVLALSGWFPILAVNDEDGWNLDPTSEIGDSVYSETAFYSVEITLPEDVIVAATGVETSRQSENGRTKFLFESGPARDFFLIASPDFEVVNQQIGETTVNSYFLSGYDARGQKALATAAESIKIFNEAFGVYPYTELDVVAAPMRYALGVEFPEIVMVNADLYQAPEKPEFEVTAAHEVAHQWWYGVVGNDVFDEPWLDEALATYSSSLYYEFGPGKTDLQGYQDYWQNRYDRLIQESGDDLITNSLGYFESLGKPGIYGGIVYIKGALFLKALRAEIGDEAFFQALQDYYETNFLLIAHTEDLLSAFERAAGRELDEFYQEWLYSRD